GQDQGVDSAGNHRAPLERFPKASMGGSRGEVPAANYPPNFERSGSPLTFITNVKRSGPYLLTASTSR
ncbi:MAG: hypothetical protein ACXWAC_16210, partial [Usitatibacter sp.]